MTTIRQADLVESIAHLARAYEAEQSPAAKDAIAQILTNSRMCAEGHRPICQDTGIVNVFLKVGMDVRWEGFTGSLEDAINEGVRRGYLDPDNVLRASVVDPPEFGRRNTRDNTPAVINVQIVPGDRLDVMVATMAKEALMDDIDMSDLLRRGARTDVEKLRVELYDKVNALGIGAQGLGGLSTVLDVKIRMYPTHAASKPVAMIPNCAATRHAHFVLDGEEVAAWKPGQTLLLNGKMLTGRDAAHKRIQDMLAKGERLPVDFTNRVIYYVGPVDPVRGEAVGPAGPTTATRMDKFTEMMLAQTGLIAMIGKAERGPAAIEAIRRHRSAYLMAVGGAAYLVAKAIKAAKVVGFDDLGMEAGFNAKVRPRMV